MQNVSALCVLSTCQIWLDGQIVYENDVYSLRGAAKEESHIVR